jgi:hypothetical protein
VVSSGGCNTSESLEAVLSSLRRVKKGPGRLRCRPNVSGSWSCGDERGASSPRPARLVCLGPQPTTGRAATRRTAMARWWGSCRCWSDWPCNGSAQGSCRRRNGSRSPTFATPGLSIRAIAQRCVGRLRRSHVNCTATPLAKAAMVPSRRTDGRRPEGLAVVADASIPTPSRGG